MTAQKKGRIAIDNESGQNKATKSSREDVTLNAYAYNIYVRALA
ncbi:MAG: hypothetical protein U0V49_08475 [Saprospiraceae bacterium]